MRLAEPEGGEGPQHLPRRLDCGDVVAGLLRAPIEPAAHRLLPFRTTHRTTHLVRFGMGTSGHHCDDPQHLFVIDHHTTGLLQRRSQIVVQVLRLVPAVTSGEERRDHVTLTGPGRNREMSMMMSSNVCGANFPINSRCPGDSIWKHPRVRVERMRSKVA